MSHGPVSHYTTDGGHLAPHPGMTDADLLDFEIHFNVPNPTFPERMPMTRNPRPPYRPPRWRASATARHALAVATIGGLLALVLAVGAWVLP